MLHNKPLPHSTDAEAAVIGACLISETALVVASEKLTPEHFYHEANRIIFDTMTTMFREGKTVDVVTLSERIRANGQLDTVGGRINLLRLQTETFTTANIDSHIAIVLEHSIRREVQAICIKYHDEAAEGMTDSLQMMAELQDQVMKMGAGMLTRTLYKPLRLAEEVFTHVRSMLDAGSHITGLPTGLTDLDFLLGGFKKGDLITVGARPSIGKSALMLSAACNMILSGTPVAIFSIEMGARSLGTRLLKMLTGLNLDSYEFLRHHTDNQREAIIEGVGQMQGLPIYIDDKPNLTGSEFFAKARRYKEEFGCEIIFCDYLQKLQKTNYRMGEREHVTEMTRTMKTTGRMLDIPVVALSQLTREVDKSTDKRPAMHHFMESGAIEAESDVVIMIHRPEYYGIQSFDDEFSTSAKGLAELIVGKHRNGMTGSVRVAYNKEQTLFCDVPRGYDPQRDYNGEYAEAF